jgi:hypothetical protein
MADEHHTTIKATLQQLQGAYDSAHPSLPVPVPFFLGQAGPTR